MIPTHPRNPKEPKNGFRTIPLPLYNHDRPRKTPRPARSMQRSSNAKEAPSRYPASSVKKPGAITGTGMGRHAIQTDGSGCAQNNAKKEWTANGARKSAQKHPYETGCSFTMPRKHHAMSAAAIRATASGRMGQVRNSSPPMIAHLVHTIAPTVRPAPENSSFNIKITSPREVEK